MGPSTLYEPAPGSLGKSQKRDPELSPVSGGGGDWGHLSSPVLEALGAHSSTLHLCCVQFLLSSGRHTLEGIFGGGQVFPLQPPGSSWQLGEKEGGEERKGATSGPWLSPHYGGRTHFLRASATQLHPRWSPPLPQPLGPWPVRGEIYGPEFFPGELSSELSRN